MNALQIPELNLKNPGDERRCVLGTDPHPSWRKVLTQLLETFPEVQSVSFAKVKPGALERSAFTPFYTMAIFLGSYMQIARVRELDLILNRLFQLEGASIRFVFARVPVSNGAAIGANLYPLTPLMDRVRSNGTMLYRRQLAPMISPLEQQVHQILLARSRNALVA